MYSCYHVYLLLQGNNGQCECKYLETKHEAHSPTPRSRITWSNSHDVIHIP